MAVMKAGYFVDKLQITLSGKSRQNNSQDAGNCTKKDSISTQNIMVTDYACNLWKLERTGFLFVNITSMFLIWSRSHKKKMNSISRKLRVPKSAEPNRTKIEKRWRDRSAIIKCLQFFRGYKSNPIYQFDLLMKVWNCLNLMEKYFTQHQKPEFYERFFPGKRTH